MRFKHFLYIEYIVILFITRLTSSFLMTAFVRAVAKKVTAKICPVQPFVREGYIDDSIRPQFRHLMPP
ncbi:hypothetical protein SAMN03080615_01356 [Amphritea atlantica]|uniref:Uncharacterized protein n=1 Tax=Amphritea atlantica TaxID=355243 RepID=A0A1H9FNH0_9GAMM|nr:hypothetical protein SAMN03080615_01356 [Amphritea atlantica]